MEQTFLNILTMPNGMEAPGLHYKFHGFVSLELVNMVYNPRTRHRQNYLS
jgi:hypothetical protein